MLGIGHIEDILYVYIYMYMCTRLRRCHVSGSTVLHCTINVNVTYPIVTNIKKYIT